jgi:hypothetical protein
MVDRESRSGRRKSVAGLPQIGREIRSHDAKSDESELHGFVPPFFTGLM